MKTPYFLILEKELNNNVMAFQHALEDLWPNSKLAYSVKTNSLPWLLQYLKKKKVMAEVVSDEEYRLAKFCGYYDNEILYNGPIKGEEQFKLAIEGNAIINLDSSKDLEYLVKYKGKTCENIGIRVNVDSTVFSREDIGYEEDGFRFGFSVENGEVEKVVRTIKDVYGEGRIGLHLHCNSITRSLNVYQEIARYVAKLIKAYDLQVSFIDMGGGYFGGVEGKPTPKDYLRVIKKELGEVINPKETKLIVEPGSAIIGSVAELHTAVLDVKDTTHARIVTTDGSRIHIDPLWAKNRYMYTANTQNEYKHPRQIICGYTCMDHDRIMILENEKEFQVGDEIIYHRVGAYSMTFGGMFIKYLPEVYVKNEQEIEKVRSKISVEDYVELYSHKGKNIK